MEFGADYLATGHYCRAQTDQPAKPLLLKGSDPNKDQSYFLYAINKEALSRTLFPVGHLLKSEVRALARQAKLATSDKKDSTGICFIGERNFKQFLSQFLDFRKAPYSPSTANRLANTMALPIIRLGSAKESALAAKEKPGLSLAKTRTKILFSSSEARTTPRSIALSSSLTS